MAAAPQESSCQGSAGQPPGLPHTQEETWLLGYRLLLRISFRLVVLQQLRSAGLVPHLRIKQHT